MVAKDSSGSQSFKKTEKNLSGGKMPEDPNKDAAASKSGKYWAYKDRSGNEIIINHQAGDHQNITIKHRTGTKIQLNPDGALVIEASKGSYTTVRGENQVYITGKNDITVDGDGSMKVKGDYNQTVTGRGNLTFEGDLQIKAKNFNLMAGCLDFGGKNVTIKNEGNMSIYSQQSLSVGAAKGVSIASVEDSVGIHGKNDVAINADGGNMTLNSGGKTSIKAKGTMSLETENKLGLKGTDIDQKASGALKLEAGGQANLKGGKDVRIQAEQNIHAKSIENLGIPFTGEASSADSAAPISADLVTSESAFKQAKAAEVECPKDSTLTDKK